MGQKCPERHLAYTAISANQLTLDNIASPVPVAHFGTNLFAYTQISQCEVILTIGNTVRLTVKLIPITCPQALCPTHLVWLFASGLVQRPSIKPASPPFDRSANHLRTVLSPINQRPNPVCRFLCHFGCK